MPQIIRCQHCTKDIKVPDNVAGKPVRCPYCRKVFTVTFAPAHALAAAAVGPAPAPSPPPARPPISRSPEAGPTVTAPPTAVSPGPTVCPACRARLLPGAVSCMDCGYLLQEAPEGEAEGPPNLCTNPACGVANSPRDRTCQRCGSPLPTPPGTMLHGRYRIQRQLAIGGFGAVYLATDTKADNRLVAIKDMICADTQEFAIRLNFFRREAEILRSLDGIPIVPRVYDFIQQGQTAHLLLEYIRGRDLLQIMEITGGRPFPIPLVIEWAKGICDVLIHMHSQSPPLVHRDVKPDNIMLLEDRRSIKMIDFGTARDIGRTRRSRLATKTRVYTEGYAPPEQIVGKPEPRSDLFALAGTLYHLVTGHCPEGTQTAHELQTQLADPSNTLPEEHRWFFELLQINLNEDPNRRYYSAREFKADLEARRITREVTCPCCQTTNKVREPYCLKCAEPLTDPTPPCSYCGQLNRMGSRCCIHCGHRLR